VDLSKGLTEPELDALIGKRDDYKLFLNHKHSMNTTWRVATNRRYWRVRGYGSEGLPAGGIRLTADAAVRWSDATGKHLVEQCLARNGALEHPSG